MGTNVKLYYTYSTQAGSKWELIPSRLFIVEDIESYLATKTCKTITDFQYIKNELEITINVDISQDYSQPRTATSFKYVSIQNSGELTHYYFVKKATWRSKTCVRFELVMDVINTFQEGRDFNFKANTRIVREHKDRFNKRVKDRFITFNFTTFIQTGTLNENDSVIVYDNTEANLLEGYFVSFTSEGIQGQLKMKISEDETRTDEEIISAMNFHRSETIKIVHDLSNLISGFLIRNTITHTYTYFRNIDIVNEGISPVLQCANATGLKIQDSRSALIKDWYLIYRNKENPLDTSQILNPVDCFLMPSTATRVSTGSLTSGRITGATLETGKYYYAKITNTNTMTLPDGTIIQPSLLPAGNPLKMVVEIFKNPNGSLTITFAAANLTSDSEPICRTWTIDYITLNDLPCDYASYESHQAFRYILDNWNDLTHYQWSSTSAPQYIDSITSLDKTDVKLIKVIKLPYCPYQFTITGGAIDIISSDWVYHDLDGVKVLKLNDLSIKLSNELNVGSLYQPLKSLHIGSLNPSINDLRLNASYESKLFSSDFYQPTYVYDSFTYKVQLEKLDINLYNESNIETLNIKFDMTKTINSRFMFTFDNLYFAYATENYAKYMPIARNNEEVLYNVPYINYIRTGFNYDVKAKNVNFASNMLSLGASMATTAISAFLPSGPLKIAGIIAGAISIANSIKNTAVTAQQNEDSIRRKLNETANQASSVAGSDDVDLMSVYAENRLKYLVYEPTPLMKSILFDLFFYDGYASGRMGKPSHNTRVNFDYLECEASLENEGSIPDDCEQELINCFKTGVCYLHKTTRVSDVWDFEQKYENWEKSVMED